MEKSEFLARVAVWDTTVEGAQTFLIDGIPASAEPWGDGAVRVSTDRTCIAAPEAWFSDCRKVSFP